MTIKVVNLSTGEVVKTYGRMNTHEIGERVGGLKMPIPPGGKPPWANAWNVCAGPPRYWTEASIATLS
jgi:hypothetical protein